MRFVIYGAGAIGATIGAKLHSAGEDVVLIARGKHLDALRRRGLRFQTPAGEETLAIPALASPDEVELDASDVVLLTMKSQDTAAALERLKARAPSDVAIVCAQNGVENERLALRLFPHVYGIPVYLPTQHIEPGVVQAFAAPTPGVVDLGRFPSGVDERAQTIAAALDAAGLASVARADIMRWKYAKLLANLHNVVEVLFGPGAEGHWAERARAEAIACYRAAAIDFTSQDEIRERRRAMGALQAVDGKPHAGGSSWQSLERGSSTLETDYLNGEIVLLGRLHGVPTPVNEALQEIARRMSRERERPGSVDPESVEAAVRRLALAGAPTGP
jgi:2-dehydropantoate 2-reductase